MRISKIDSNLSIYKENKVIICGGGSNGHVFSLLNQFKDFNIKVYAICENNKSFWGQKYENIPIISPAELKKLTEENDDIIVQIGGIHKEEDNIINWLKSINISNFIHHKEAFSILSQLKVIKSIKDDGNMLDNLSNYHFNLTMGDVQRNIFQYFLSGDKPLLLCIPPKVGNVTLVNTLSNNQRGYCATGHMVGALNKSILNAFGQTVKIITGVRDPIAQNISRLYQHLDEFVPFLLMYEPEKLSGIFDNGGDMQDAFETMFFKKARYLEDLPPYGVTDTDKMTASEIIDYQFTRLYNIQRFMPEFQANILDIMKEPFDKEKGCSVIKSGNIEVFIYQLEKMNNILPELSEFVGRDIKQYVNANIADDKWCGEAYKKAQKELKFSREYFDKCYNEPYVKHFYSDKDIDKFKQKWQNNVIN